MKNINPIILCILLLCGLLSCDSKNLARRYTNKGKTSMFRLAGAPQTFVQVGVKTAMVSDPARPVVKYNMLSLLPEGQEAYIQSAKALSADSNAFLAMVNTNFSFSTAAKPNIKVIPKTLTKIFIFEVDKLQYQYVNPTDAFNFGNTIFNTPGDRIAFLELQLRLPNTSNMIFNSWDTYSSRYLTQSLGKVTSSQNWNASLTASATAGAQVAFNTSNTREGFESNKDTSGATLVNTGAAGSDTTSNGYELIETDKGTRVNSKGLTGSGTLGLSGTVGYQNNYETSTDLLSRRLELTGVLGERSLILRQEGGVLIDLSGNVQVTVELLITDDWATPVDLFKFTDLYASGVPIPPGTIKRSMMTLVFPDVQSDITGTLDYSFLYRQIRSGHRHLPEARQKVRFWHGFVNSAANVKLIAEPAVLLRRDDIRPKIYELRLGPNALAFDNISLRFETAEEAVTFLRYIGDLVLNRIAIANITVGGVALSPSSYNAINIVTVQL